MRAIAALIVVFGHIELAKSRYLNIEVYNDYFPSGRLSVILFFVLSGFLISYLLIKEFEVTKTISFKRFYSRRNQHDMDLKKKKQSFMKRAVGGRLR